MHVSLADQTGNCRGCLHRNTTAWGVASCAPARSHKQCAHNKKLFAVLCWLASSHASPFAAPHPPQHLPINPLHLASRTYWTFSRDPTHSKQHTRRPPQGSRRAPMLLVCRGRQQSCVKEQTAKIQTTTVTKKQQQLQQWQQQQQKRWTHCQPQPPQQQQQQQSHHSHSHPQRRQLPQNRALTQPQHPQKRRAVQRCLQTYLLLVQRTRRKLAWGRRVVEGTTH